MPKLTRIQKVAQMLIAHSTAKLHTELDSLRFKGGTRRCVSLVTTRGDMHEGHGSVINAAKTVSDVVVVAILPSQPSATKNVVTAAEFQDISFAEQHHADVLFAPQDISIQPPRDAISIATPCLDSDFSVGLLTSHIRLINAVQPDIMVWGERNFLEYRLVRQAIGELGIRTQLQCVPTVRHADGVAVSAHDNTMPETTRAKLPIVFQTLRNAAHAIRSGASQFSNVESTAKIALKGAGFEVSSFKILNDDDLSPADTETTSYRITTKATIEGNTIVDSLGLTL